MEEREAETDAGSWPARHRAAPLLFPFHNYFMLLNASMLSALQVLIWGCEHSSKSDPAGAGSWRLTCAGAGEQSGRSEPRPSRAAVQTRRFPYPGAVGKGTASSTCLSEWLCLSCATTNGTAVHHSQSVAPPFGF